MHRPPLHATATKYSLVYRMPLSARAASHMPLGVLLIPNVHVATYKLSLLLPFPVVDLGLGRPSDRQKCIPTRRPAQL